MSDPVAMRDLIPPDLLATPDLLLAITARSEARLVADRPLPDLANHTHDELRDAGLTPAAARRLACAFELGRRLHIAPLRPPPVAVLRRTSLAEHAVAFIGRAVTRAC